MTDVAHFFDTQRLVAEEVERSRMEAARLALHNHLRTHPGASLNAISEALVPPRPFELLHLSRVILADLDSGDLEWLVHGVRLKDT